MVDLDIKALTFDVFGTVVDWRGSIGREGSVWGDTKELELDWFAFADAWRGLYQPAMDKFGWPPSHELAPTVGRVWPG